MFNYNKLILGFGVVCVVAGAGCSSTPVDVSYQQDANGYKTQTSTVLSTSTAAYVPPPAATAVTPTKKPTTVKKPTTNPTTPATTALSASAAYLKALDTYKKAGLYIEFSNCHGLPGSLVVKKGTAVMFDNRDGKGHTFGYEGKLYGAGSYRYAIVTAQRAGTNYITCDGGGAAQLVVQP